MKLLQMKLFIIFIIIFDRICSNSIDTRGANINLRNEFGKTALMIALIEDTIKNIMLINLKYFIIIL